MLPATDPACRGRRRVGETASPTCGAAPARSAAVSTSTPGRARARPRRFAWRCRVSRRRPDERPTHAGGVPATETGQAVMTMPSSDSGVIRAAIVEDQRDIRDGLAMLINGTPGYRCTGIYRTMEDALTGITADLP